MKHIRRQHIEISKTQVNKIMKYAEEKGFTGGQLVDLMFRHNIGVYYIHYEDGRWGYRKMPNTINQLSKESLLDLKYYIGFEAYLAKEHSRKLQCYVENYSEETAYNLLNDRSGRLPDGDRNIMATIMSLHNIEREYSLHNRHR